MDKDPNAPDDEILEIVAEILTLRTRWARRNADLTILGPALSLEGLVILRSTVGSRKAFRKVVDLLTKKAEREHAKWAAADPDVPSGMVH